MVKSKIIIVDYLSDGDYVQPSYVSAKKDIKKHKVIKCNDYVSFEREITQLGTFEENTILTILSHGHIRGIAKGTYDTLITWCELIKIVNNCKGNHLLILNLLAVCNSSNIETFTNFCINQIDEYWVSNDNVNSITKSIDALRHSNLATFIGLLEEEEKSLYKSIKRNNQ
jgi:hypothetical protein